MSKELKKKIADRMFKLVKNKHCGGKNNDCCFCISDNFRRYRNLGIPVKSVEAISNMCKPLSKKIRILMDKEVEELLEDIVHDMRELEKDKFPCIVCNRLFPEWILDANETMCANCFEEKVS